MDDHVYANIDALTSLNSALKTRYEAIISASNEFYRKAGGNNWRDDLAERALECYRTVVYEAEKMLAIIDGSRIILGEQISDLNSYFAVNIKRN